jgi:transposase
MDQIDALTEDTRMLSDWSPRRVGEFDEQVYRACVPADHYLRRALKLIQWGGFREVLAGYYCPDHGRPCEDPVFMLKLEYLRYRDNLSDRQVIARAQTDMAYRYFLRIGVGERLPDPSSLCYFRGRLGAKGFRDVFDQLISQAREHGLVKDRLRIKDASHVIADVAVPSALALVAQVRDKLLAAAEPFDAVRVEGERVNVAVLRESSDGRSNEERLLGRVTHLREILAWADELPPPQDAQENGQWQEFLKARQLAHKILWDQDHREGGNLTRSTVDPDARRGKHGEWYDGYLLDVLVDADSELITAVNVLPANGNEGADAPELVRQEEQAHGNDIAQISIDGAGYQGAVLRELEDPTGLAMEAFVPPRDDSADNTFTPKDFVEDSEHRFVTCPAGKTSRYRQRDERRGGSIYRFLRSVCESCPLVLHCIGNMPEGKKFGRTVRKTDYDAEYQRVREKAKTPEYAAIRSEHAKVERKLGEVMNRHGGRRARYRGQPKVLYQELMACTATNIKRMVALLCAPPALHTTS